MPESDQTETNPPKSPKCFVDQVRQHLASHPITAAWNAALLIGGVIFIGYFVSIGFMPKLDFQASVSLLVAAAVVGVGLFLMLISLLLLPGWMWTTGVISDERLKPLWHKKSETEEEPETGTIPPPEWKRAAWFVIPHLLIVGGVFAAVVWFESLILVIPVSFLIIAISGLCVWYKLHSKSKDESQGKKGRKEAVFTYSSGLFQTALIFVPFLLIPILASQNSSLDDRAICIAPGTLAGVVLVNGVFVMSQTLYQRIGIIGLVFIAFTMLSGWDFIPKQVMAFYQLGNVANASLVLDKTGCSIARQHSITPDSTAAETCSMDSTTIQSRIGTPFLIEAKDAEGNDLSFTIPEEHVLSWSLQQRDE